jgi:hypothetical protein
MPLEEESSKLLYFDGMHFWMWLEFYDMQDDIQNNVSAVYRYIDPDEGKV